MEKIVNKMDLEKFESELLPQLYQKVQIEKHENKERLVWLQNFVTAINQNVPNGIVRKNKFADNTNYIPIGHLEMMLDKFFFGLWETRNFKTTTIANELVGEIELRVYHPIEKIWITRTGAAGVLIRQNKGAEITDISKKIKNTLAMDYPHLKAQCVRNAVLSLGRLFGRDLNREHTPDTFKGLYKEDNNLVIKNKGAENE